MSATAERVCFSIEGEWLANFARTRVMEGAWESALQILVRDCSCTHEQAIQILKGHATFTGVSSDEDGLGWKELPPKGKIAKDMQHQLDYLYGAVFKHGDKYWKPYAYVQGWGPEDMKFNHEYSGSRNILGSSERQKYLLRSLYYANDPGRDMLIYIDAAPDKISDVLCEETPMPPLWYEVSVNRPIEHLLKLRNSGKLRIERRGASSEPYLGVSTIRYNDIVEPGYRGSAREEKKSAAEITTEFLDELNKATTIDQIRAIEQKYEGADAEAYDQSQAIIEKITCKRIQKQADEVGGWYELNLRTENNPNYDPPTLRVPKNAFLRWALRGFHFENFGKVTPEWSCVTSSGWKLPLDDPFHTDWVIGAGIPLAQTYDRNSESLGAVAMTAAHEAKYNLVKEWTGVEFSILARGDESWIGGEIVHPKPNNRVAPGSIAIVPSAGPDYYNAMVSACKPDPKYDRPGLIICETGGKLAHLAIVGREQKCTVLLVPNALKKYLPGDRISINFETNQITVTL